MPAGSRASRVGAAERGDERAAPLGFELPGYEPAKPKPRARRPPGQTKYEGGAPPPDPLVRDPEEAVFTREPGKIFGDDDRVPVPDPTIAPFRHVCALRIEAADMTPFVGTGWLVAPRTVITAGHCLFIPRHGGRVRRVQVLPAFDARLPPRYEEASSSIFEVHEAWERRRDERFDFGAIFLEGDGLPACGAFGFAAVTDELLMARPLNVAGYPRDRDDASRQYFHGRRARSADRHTIQYETDTSAGQSGCPVWIQHHGRRYAVGIHTYGGQAFNQAVRIDQDVFERLREWKKRGTSR